MWSHLLAGQSIVIDVVLQRIVIWRSVDKMIPELLQYEIKLACAFTGVDISHQTFTLSSRVT